MAMLVGCGPWEIYSKRGSFKYFKYFIANTKREHLQNKTLMLLQFTFLFTAYLPTSLHRHQRKSVVGVPDTAAW